jgi:hypothetical protein
LTGLSEAQQVENDVYRVIQEWLPGFVWHYGTDLEYQLQVKYAAADKDGVYFRYEDQPYEDAWYGRRTFRVRVVVEEVGSV